MRVVVTGATGDGGTSVLEALSGERSADATTGIAGPWRIHDFAIGTGGADRVDRLEHRAVAHGR